MDGAQRHTKARRSNIHKRRRSSYDISSVEEESCIVHDENEEFSVAMVRAPLMGGGSFRRSSDHRQAPIINKINTLMINNVTSRKVAPNFSKPTTTYTSGR